MIYFFKINKKGTVDDCRLNDIGFMSMAKAVEKSACEIGLIRWC